jgi:hypothetical protein
VFPNQRPVAAAMGLLKSWLLLRMVLPSCCSVMLQRAALIRMLISACKCAVQPHCCVVQSAAVLIMCVKPTQGLVVNNGLACTKGVRMRQLHPKRPAEQGILCWTMAHSVFQAEKVPNSTQQLPYNTLSLPLPTPLRSHTCSEVTLTYMQ